ncbi:MAG: hypothetical protein KF756_05500 [Acidobacteria bacterium]|nr:hypothetical protein [Acidobacteriota bacterium]
MLFSRTTSAASVKSLGAGDLIDRTVRLYRRNFGVFMLIAAPPVVVGTLLTLGWSILTRTVIFPDAAVASGDTATYYFILAFGTANVWLVEIIATLVVMGGASRNFVRHLLFDEPLSFRQTYANCASRIWSLIIASTLITIAVGIITLFATYVGMIAIFIPVGLLAFLLSSVPPLAVVVCITVGLAVLYGVLWLTLLVVSRVAFVPQAMLVEGLGVGSAFGRSAAFSTWSVRRLMALLVFTTVATIAALAILYVPVAWFAWANGIELTDAEVVPLWLSVIYSMIGQLCFMLLSPVWMIGLSLLYVDTRIQSEAYDIELLATKRLGEIPDLPPDYFNPLQPALGHTKNRTTTLVQPGGTGSNSMLGLK